MFLENASEITSNNAFIKNVHADISNANTAGDNTTVITSKDDAEITHKVTFKDIDHAPIANYNIAGNHAAINTYSYVAEMT